jgi:DNA repair ATPase RecN
MSTQEDYRRDIEDVRDRLGCAMESISALESIDDRLTDLQNTPDTLIQAYKQLAEAYNKLADGLAPAIDKIIQSLRQPAAPSPIFSRGPVAEKKQHPTKNGRAKE